MADNRPIDLNGASAVNSPAGFFTGDPNEAFRQLAQKREEQEALIKEAEEAARQAANQDPVILQRFLRVYADAAGSRGIDRGNMDHLINNGSFQSLAERLNVAGQSEKLAIFQAKDKSYSIVVTPSGAFHNDTDPHVSPQEAIDSAIAASGLASVKRYGANIGGTDEQKAMYYLGLQELNKTLPNKIKIVNQKEIDAIPDAIMNKAKAEFAAHLQAQQQQNNQNTQPTADNRSTEEITGHLPDGAIAAQDENGDMQRFVEGDETQDSNFMPYQSDYYGEQTVTLADDDIQAEAPKGEHRAIPSGMLPDGVFGVQDPDGNVQFFTTNEEAVVPSVAQALEGNLYEDTADIVVNGSLDATHPRGTVIPSDDPETKVLTLHCRPDDVPATEARLNEILEKITERVEAQAAFDKAQIDGGVTVTLKDSERAKLSSETAKIMAPIVQQSRAEAIVNDDDVYNALKYHIVSEGAATNGVVREFLSSSVNAKSGLTEGITNKNIDQAVKGFGERLAQEPFINIVQRGAVNMRVLNMNAQFHEAAKDAPEVITPTIASTEPTFKATKPAGLTA